MVLTRLVAHWCVPSRRVRATKNVRIVYIRDWHDPRDARQRAELDFFGDHCLIGTTGARFIDVLEEYSRDRQRAAIVDATGISDFEDTPIADIISVQVGNADRERLPVGVVGVWTNVKVSLPALRPQDSGSAAQSGYVCKVGGGPPILPSTATLCATCRKS